MGVNSSPSGMFPLIQALPHEVVPPLQAFQNQVDARLSGAAPIGSGANFNEPAQYNLGAEAAVFRGADGTSTTSVVPTKPGVVLQFFRKNASSIGVQLGFYQTAVLDQDTDFYGLHQFGRFSANLTASSGRLYNNHGIRAYLSIDPSNIGTNIVIGYGGWIQAIKSVSGARVVGMQVEGNNNSGVDDLTDPSFGVQSSIGVAFSSNGNAHASTHMFLEGPTPVSASYTGMYVQRDSVVRHVIDARTNVFHLSGTVTATNGSPTITGVGTKFLTEILAGDHVLIDGIFCMVLGTPVSETSATLSANFAGTTGAYTSVVKTVVFARLSAMSYITASDALTGATDYRLIGLTSTNTVSIDADAKGTVLGGTLAIGRAAPLSTTSVHVVGPNNPSGIPSGVGVITIESNTALAADIGGSIAFRGIFTGTSSAGFGGIKAGKTNATDGNLDTYMALYTRSHAGGILERARIDAAGNTGFGTTTISARLHSFSTTEQLRLGYDASNFASFTVGSGGNLTVAPTGDYIFDPTGNDVRPEVNYDLNFGTLDKKWLTIHGAELRVETLVAAETMTMINGRAVIGSNATILIADLAPDATAIDVKHNGLVNGDILWMETIGQVEFMAAASGPTTITGGFRYSVTRNLDGSGANQWYAGDAVTNLGTTGTGWIDIYSIRGMKTAAQVGPTIVGNVRNSTTFNDWSEHWAIGNLNGLYGYGVTTFGVAFGKYAAGTAHITIDATNGYRIFKDTATVIGQWDNSGVITIGEVGASKDNILISSGAFSVRNNTTARIHMTAAGVMTINDSAGAAKITLDASAGMTLDGKMQMLGASSAIAIGTTPPTSAALGTGLWIDRTGMYGLALDVVQAKFDAATGAITFGAGAGVLNAAGINLKSEATFQVVNSYNTSTSGGDILSSQYSFYDAGGHEAGLTSASVAGHNSSLALLSSSPTGKTSEIRLTALVNNGATEWVVLKGNGLGFQVKGSMCVGDEATPAATLDVRGSAKFTGTLTAGSAPTTLTSATGKLLLAAVDVSVSSSGQVLTSTGTGTAPTWQTPSGGGSGANTALSNLASVAINENLLPATAGAVNLGSTAKPFGHLFLASGGTIDWNNGATILLHETGHLGLRGARFSVVAAPDATANYGLFNLGAGPFDGTASGFFTGPAAGTHLAINAASGSTADLINAQLAGVARFKIGANGSTLFQNLVRVQGALDVPAGASGAGFEMFAAAAGHSVFQSFNRTSSALAPLHLYSTTILISNAVGTPTAFAILDLQSTTSAFMPPRMTTTQRDAMTAADGMLLYNLTTGALNYRKAGAWVAI